MRGGGAGHVTGVDATRADRTIPRICDVDGCDRTVKARGWCKTHYSRWYRHGDPGGAALRTHHGEMIPIGPLDRALKDRQVSAKSLGASNSRVIYRARKRGTISEGVADRIAVALGLTLDEIYGETGAVEEGDGMDDWAERAACIGLDVDLFFPASPDDVWPEIAAICGRCEVRDRCLETALRQGIWDGIWGGLSPDQRRKAAREAGIPRHGTITGYTRDGCREVCCKAEMAEASRRARERRSA